MYHKKTAEAKVVKDSCRVRRGVARKELQSLQQDAIKDWKLRWIRGFCDVHAANLSKSKWSTPNARVTRDFSQDV